MQHRFAQHPFRHYQFAHDDGQIAIYRHFRRGLFSGASLLAVYGNDVRLTTQRWLALMWHEGVRLVHTLTSPNSLIKEGIQQTAVTILLPYHRTPYYLTAKPLTDTTPDNLFNFAQWDCIGGDIL